MYAFDILSAIKEIHKHGVIHADIKPQNFLLFNTNEFQTEEVDEYDDNSSTDSYDPNKILKVTDFGLAHILDGNNTKAYMKYRAGTHEYKAPEISDVTLALFRIVM